MVVSKTELPTPDEVLPGREESLQVSDTHAVNNASTVEPFPQGSQLALFGMGCFWGAEKVFWEHPGVISTQVGYSGGITSNPTYKEVCTGLTGHTEVVRIVYDPKVTSFDDLLELFWTNHDPTQGMKQDIDIGTQYRSAIYYYNEEQAEKAIKSLETYQRKLEEQGLGKITTEITPFSKFYYAEDYHQQYLHKNTGAVCHKSSAPGGACSRPTKH